MRAIEVLNPLEAAANISQASLIKRTNLFVPQWFHINIRNRFPEGADTNVWELENVKIKLKFRKLKKLKLNYTSIE